MLCPFRHVVRLLWAKDFEVDDRLDLAGALRLAPRDGSAPILVECFADEAVGLALAAGLDVLAIIQRTERHGDKSSFRLEPGTSLDTSLEQRGR